MIVGFVVTALSGVVSYVQTVTTRGYYFDSFRQVVIPMLEPLTLIAAACAWWWLSMVVANDEHQRVNLQRAYVAFALQYLLVSVLVVFLITPFRSLGGFWLTTVLWGQLIGAFIAALGLFLLSRTLSARDVVVDLDPDPAASD